MRSAFGVILARGLTEADALVAALEAA